MQQSFGLGQNNPTGLPAGDFALTVADPPACTVGFLPPSQWRSPEDQTAIDTPDGLYCKLPQDSPTRRARRPQLPLHGRIQESGQPTVELCNDPRGYQPLAMRQHYRRPVSVRPESDRAGRPARRSRRRQRPDLCAGGGHADAAGCGPCGNAARHPPPGGPLPGPPPAGADAQAPIAPPPPPGNSLNGAPIPEAPPAEAAPVEPAAGDGAMPAAPSAFARQRFWRTVGRRNALRPAARATT